MRPVWSRPPRSAKSRGTLPAAGGRWRRAGARPVARPRRALRQHRHALPVAGIPSDRGVYHGALPLRRAAHQRQVAALGGPVLDTGAAGSGRRGRCAPPPAGPEVSRSSRCTIPGRLTPPASLQPRPTRPSSAFTSVPLQFPRRGCTTSPFGLLTTSRSSSSWTRSSGIAWERSPLAARGRSSGRSPGRSRTPPGPAPITTTSPASIRRWSAERVSSGRQVCRKRSNRSPAATVGNQRFAGERRRIGRHRLAPRRRRVPASRARTGTPTGGATAGRFAVGGARRARRSRTQRGRR